MVDEPGAVGRPIGQISAFLEDVRARGFRPRGIVDVGANEGYWTQMCRQVFPDSRYLLIEPQDEMSDYLQHLADTNKDIHFVKTAAGAQSGVLVQTIWEDLSGSSFLPQTSEEKLRSGEQRWTPMRTLDSLVAEIEGFHPDFVKLDVQGFELEALKGGSNLFGRTELFILETSLYELMPSMPTTADCISFMRERDYDMYDITEFLRRPYDGALGQIDIAFAKRGGLLMNSSQWFAPR